MMTPEERFWTAVRLEKPDRVPIAPILDAAPASKLLGLKSWEVVAQGLDAQLDAILGVFDAFGGWDALNAPLPPQLLPLAGINGKYPSEDSPESQMIETEIWTAEEYGLLTEIGLRRFLSEHLIHRLPEMTDSNRIEDLLQSFMALTSRYISEAGKRGAVPWISTIALHPFFRLSLTRSMLGFTRDLYERPDMVEKALRVIVPEWIQDALWLCKTTGSKIYYIAEERAGAFFYSLEMFERFWWPYTLQIVDAFWSEGIVTAFHLDTCWDKNIPYFKQLPRGSAIIDLDGTTDIFAAKEVLGNHLCIAGDVHPALLSLGTPEEVEAYCRRLINELGKDGGFILQAGCSIPYAVKPENFRAMIETGKLK